MNPLSTTYEGHINQSIQKPSIQVQPVVVMCTLFAFEYKEAFTLADTAWENNLPVNNLDGDQPIKPKSGLCLDRKRLPLD